MENNLEFLETYTVEQFKAKELVDTLRVMKNEKTQKLFFSYGARTGAVAAKGIPTKPMISLVKQKDDPCANTFYLLHEESSTSAPVLCTL